MVSLTPHSYSSWTSLKSLPHFFKIIQCVDFGVDCYKTNKNGQRRNHNHPNHYEQSYIQISVSLFFFFYESVTEMPLFTILHRSLQLFYSQQLEWFLFHFVQVPTLCNKMECLINCIHSHTIEIKFKEKNKQKHFHVTYRGKTDSTPTPATSLRNLKVEFKPALRLAITVPLSIETRRLFSGTTCWYKG